MLWSRDGHADAAMSDSCRMMRIWGCMSAEEIWYRIIGKIIGQKWVKMGQKWAKIIKKSFNNMLKNGTKIGIFYYYDAIIAHRCALRIEKNGAWPSLLWTYDIFYHLRNPDGQRLWRPPPPPPLLSQSTPPHPRWSPLAPTIPVTRVSDMSGRRFWLW